MQSCRFWGKGVHVLVVYYDEENVLLKDLEKLQDEKFEMIGSLADVIINADTYSKGWTE